jgi:hypothetical protein
VQDRRRKMKISIVWIVVERVGLGARMASFLVEEMMVEPGLVCLGDTRAPSSALSKALRISELAANRQLLEHDRRMIPANLSLCFGVVAVSIENRVPVGFCRYRRGIN